MRKKHILGWVLVVLLGWKTLGTGTEAYAEETTAHVQMEEGAQEAEGIISSPQETEGEVEAGEKEGNSAVENVQEESSNEERKAVLRRGSVLAPPASGTAAHYVVKQKFDDLSISGEDIITKISIMDAAGVELTPDTILTDGMKLSMDYQFDFQRTGHSIVVGDIFEFKIPGWAQFITTPFTVEIMEDDDTDGTPVARITVDSLGTDGYYPAEIEILKLKTQGGTKDWTQLIHFWFEFQLDGMSVRKQIHDWDMNTGTVGMDVGILPKPGFRYNATITPQLLKDKQGRIDTVAGGKAMITWTVDLQPDTAEGIGGVSFQRVILTDMIPDGQNYVEGSLKYDDGTGGLTALGDTDPGITVAGNTLILDAGKLWGGQMRS